jgi:hypothetical protein
MKNNNRGLAVLLAALLLGCASVTKDIEVDAVADPDADFSSYQTYSWVVASALLNDPYAQWDAPGFDPVMEIKSLVDAALQKRGMSQTTTNPDLLVAFGAGVDMAALGVKVDPDTKANMLAYVPQGGLVLVMMDNKTGYLSWVGVATGEIQDDPDDKTIKKRLDYAVSEMIKKMPK